MKLGISQSNLITQAGLIIIDNNPYFKDKKSEIYIVEITCPGSRNKEKTRLF